MYEAESRTQFLSKDRLFFLKGNILQSVQPEQI